MSKKGVLVTSIALLFSFIIYSQNKAYKSGEIYTQNIYQYGKMEVRMLAATGSGVISNFFTFKEGSELSTTFWEEIDIEVFGKDGANSWQSNLITGQGNSNLTRTEGVHQENGLGEEYHTYTIEWKPGSVVWYVDGEKIREVIGGQAELMDDLTSLRFNLWNPNIPGWVGSFNENILPVHMYVNWIKFYEWNGNSFDSSPSLEDNFDSFDSDTWTKANHTFAENMADFIPENVTAQDGYLVLSLTKDGETGYNGNPPVDEITDVHDPIALIEAYPSSGQAPLSVSFDASDSSDPEGEPLTFSWDFGDNSSGTGATPTHVYTSNGLYTAVVTVTNTSGGSATAAIDINVSNAPIHDPVAIAEASLSSGQAPLSVSFDASDSSDPEGEALTFSWDFGDNSSGSGVAPTHVYTSGGIYTAVVTVSNTSGGSATAAIEINVSNAPIHDPVAIVEASLSSGQAPLSVSFDASDSSDPEGEALAFSWDFGDNSYGSGTTPTHVYTSGGVYTVVVTVSNTSGGSATASVVIDVENGDNNTDCLFDTPISTPLATIHGSYTNIYVLGSGGPDLSNVTNFVVNWDLYNNGLWQLSFNTNNGIPNWWMDLRYSSSHTFGSTEPSLTFSGTGITGFDGAYDVNIVGEDFVMVSKTGDFSIYFSKSSSVPECSKSAAFSVFEDVLKISPNPSSTHFKLSLPVTLSKSNVTVKIFDISGKRIQSLDHEFGNNELVFGKELKTGVYVGQVYEDGSPIKNFTVIKE
ncbi:PKD domain-containing protein [Aquimarina pacifica]|uniref:PKD domain-containing protein n=1 Tax=Aquimarina pacifica TaxID=1296415 RepID=UPI00047026C4|nr:PKD domain-containing protein [Aquimarina pacifica]